MNCRDGDGLIDREVPILHDLPPKEITVVCSIIPPVAEVYTTDNDPCFESTVDFVEWTNINPPTCSARIVQRTWNTSDPQGNSARFVQTIRQDADDLGPDWATFPEDTVIFLRTELHLGLLSPDRTGGWPIVRDDCQIKNIIRYEDTVVITPCSALKVIKRQWTATDLCDNVSSRIQTIHVTTQITDFRGSAYQLIALGEATFSHGPAFIEGSVAVRGDGKFSPALESVGGGSCVLTGSYVYSGGDIHFDSAALPYDPMTLPNTTIMYAGVMRGKGQGKKRNLEGKKTGGSKSRKKEAAQNTWSQKIGVAGAAEEWFESMMNDARKASSRLAENQLGQLQDGATELICTNSNTSNTIDAACEPMPESNLIDSTSGVVSVQGKDVHLQCVHPVFNVFYLPFEHFFSKTPPKSSKKQGSSATYEDLRVLINCTAHATVVINLNDDHGIDNALSSVSSSGKAGSKKMGKKMGKRRYYSAASYKLTGGCISEQIIVNIQDPSIERLMLSGISENSTLPFSVLAPNADLRIDQLSITGQVVARDLEFHGACNISCPIFHGSYSCS